MQQFVTAVPGTVHIGLTTSIEGYLLPNGTFRYGQDYVSLLLGYAKNYISQGSKKSKKKWKALRCKGFTGEQIQLKVSRVMGGATYPQSISFEDLCIFVEHEAVEVKNPKAIALLTASFREVLRSRTQDAFGLPQDSTEQKVVEFEINFQDYQEDKEELSNLELYGDCELIHDALWWNKLERLYLGEEKPSLEL